MNSERLSLDAIVTKMDIPCSIVAKGQLLEEGGQPDIPQFSKLEILELSSGLWLKELTGAKLKNSSQLSAELRKARIFYLDRLSGQHGFLKFTGSITVDDLLALLAFDEDGVLGYTDDLSFCFSLDFDASAKTLELSVRPRVLSMTCFAGHTR